MLYHNTSQSDQYRTRGPLRGNPDENSMDILVTQQVDEYFDLCFCQSGLW